MLTFCVGYSKIYVYFSERQVAFNDAHREGLVGEKPWLVENAKPLLRLKNTQIKWH